LRTNDRSRARDLAGEERIQRVGRITNLFRQ
jgi:hypothetical protein